MKNKEIKILLSAPRGFCAGVERAIEIVEKSIQKYGAPVYVRHEIVHNKFVVDDLKKAGYHIILIGHKNHPEVIGTMGQLPEGAIDLIQSEEEAKNYNDKDNRKIAFVTQTTLSVDDTKEIIKILKNKFENIREPQKEDICYATTNRQMAVKNIAKNCDMFFIIGSRNSSNSVRLVEVAKKSGCENSMLIHSKSEIPYDKIEHTNTIGISSGASAPEVLVDNFINDLKNRFTIKIDEVEIIKEDVVFKIPKKLN